MPRLSGIGRSSTLPLAKRDAEKGDLASASSGWVMLGCTWRRPSPRAETACSASTSTRPRSRSWRLAAPTSAILTVRAHRLPCARWFDGATDFLRLGEVDAILVWADADDAPARARSQLRRRDDTPDRPDLAARPVDRAPKHYLSRHRGEVMKPILEQARPRVPI